MSPSGRFEESAKALFNRPLIAWMFVLLALAACVWFWFFPPLPGVAIAVLGATAAIVAFADMRGTHKLLATIAIFVLMGIEINDIRTDRRESDNQAAEQRRRDRDSFDKIAKRIDSSIRQSQDQFKQTMTGVGQVFDKTKEAAATATEAVNTITGGKGWAYIDLDTTLIYGHVTDTLQVQLHVVNSKVLRDLHTHIVDYKAFQSDRTPIDPQTVMQRDAVTTSLGDVRGLVEVFRPIGIDTKKKELDYFITFFALNGTWREELHYKRNGDKLQHAYRVVWEDFPPDGSAAGVKERVIREDVSSDYPRVNGQVKWEAPIER